MLQSKWHDQHSGGASQNGVRDDSAEFATYVMDALTEQELDPSVLCVVVYFFHTLDFSK